VSTSDPSASDIARLQEASEWVQRLSETHEDSQALTDQWMQWCNSDALNLPAFEHMQRVWDAFASAGDAPNCVPTPGYRQEHRFGLLALAACVALAIAGTAWLVSAYSDTRELATPAGEQRSVVLADGTHLDLAPDSLVSTRFTLLRRDVQLKRGQAFFAVAHNPVRPFTVHASNLTVTAIGTAFDVRIGPGKTVVTVSAGRVTVSPTTAESAGGRSSQGETIRASVGQRVTLSNTAQWLSVATVDPQVAESWREGTLEFVSESLDEVVAAVNRYSAARIVLAPELQQTRFTGTVSLNNVDEWLEALEQIYAVKVVDQGVHGTLIRTRTPRGARE
jgi:transmembrane sensor